MLRSIQTEAALTVLPPPGVGAPFAIQRESSIYGQAVTILRSPLSPSETWAALQNLVRNPWEGLAAWFAGKGISFEKSKESDSFSLNEMVVPDGYWLPFFQQCARRMHCASTATLVLARMGVDYTPSRPCAFVAAEDGIELLVKTAVTATTRMGATIYGGGSSMEPLEVLVQYRDFSVSGSSLGLQAGKVKSVADENATDLFAEPLLAGAGFTFQCELFYKEKWYTDDGFQTLKGAQKRLEEMVAEGQKGRLLNALTKQIINL